MEPDPEAIEARFRPLIEQELAALAEQSEATREHRQPVELDQQSVGRLSRMDALQMQAMAKAVEQRRRSRLVALDQALRRMKDGDYGFCIACDEFIGEKRLQIDPATPKCVRCA
ncbi:MAG: TraR/DksA C4-type zinc finger protein [Mesorhizobium sp.]|nr:TraR/DksA C4-type zinc finger protein [Mesorhizobium sp.]